MRTVKKISFTLCLCLALFFNSCSNSQYKTESEFLMGTLVEVTASDSRAGKIVFDVFKTLEKSFNAFDSESELSRLNKDSKITASGLFFNFMLRVSDYVDLTDNAFDPAVGSLSMLWKQAINDSKVPSAQRLDRAQELSGWQHVNFDEKNNKIWFDMPGVNIDLGAVAKGFALDMAAARLKSQGIHSALINAGGDIYCLGSKNGLAWKIGVRNPRRINQVVTFYELSDKAIATSGDYEQFFLLENKRYSHIIDPRSGYPASNSISSVSVIAPDCTSADVLSTAVFVLGEEEGLKLVEKFPGVEIKIIREMSL